MNCQCVEHATRAQLSLTPSDLSQLRIKRLRLDKFTGWLWSMLKMTVNHHHQNGRTTIVALVKRESAVLVCYCFLLFTLFAGIYGQKEKEPKKAETVKELFNTSSCIPKPYRCPHPRIQFFLYTRRTQQRPELLDVTKQESLFNTQFNRAYPTKIVVHGFGGGRNLAPSTDMRDAYFKRGNYNIIIVDYGSLVKEPCLKQMEWAPRFCAKCISQLVRYLSTHPRGVKADYLHMVGYSVGAHISGLVANYLDPVVDGKLGRITGLDPTIVFYMGNNRSRDLDPTDAHFVDVLHTGAGILGQWGPNGHADFYINGGSSQPGCAHDTIFKTLACDHTKVTPYFIESIVTTKGFWAYPCPTLISYMLGWCSPEEQDYVQMGEHVTHKARGIYYVTTNAHKPYAQGHPGKRKRPHGPPPGSRRPNFNVF